MTKLSDLFGQYVDSVFNVAARILWNRADAEDVVQTTFIKAAGGIANLRAESSAKAWLLQIAHRESIAVLRRRRDVPTDPACLPAQTSSDSSPEAAAVAADVARIVSAALDSLAVDERTAVVLRDIEGLAMREVAKILEIGNSAAKMRVHRGRNALRLVLERDLSDEL